MDDWQHTLSALQPAATTADIPETGHTAAVVAPSGALASSSASRTRGPRSPSGGLGRRGGAGRKKGVSISYPYPLAGLRHQAPQHLARFARQGEHGRAQAELGSVRLEGVWPKTTSLLLRSGQAA